MWTRADFDNAANEIGRQFAASGGTSRINDLATKVATDNQLNPEGINTLVRLANVAAFQELFTKRAGSEDRMIEFEVGDPDLVINNIYSNVKCAAVAEQKSVRASSYDRAMDWYGPMATKTAEEEDAPADFPGEDNESEEPETNEEETVLGKKVDSPTNPPEAPMVDKKAMAKFNVKRAQEAINEESCRLLHEWGQSLEKAAQTMRVGFGTPKFNEEKYAHFTSIVAELGADTIPEVNALNVLQGGEYGDTRLSTDKLASAPEREVSQFSSTRDGAQICDFVKQASAARKKRESYATAIQWLDTKMTELG
jgi:hypothetical protein